MPTDTTFDGIPDGGHRTAANPLPMKHILSYTRRALDDYGMIRSGERIAVGVSAGKDSLTLLCALARLRQFYPIPFELSAITVDMGFGGVPGDYSGIRAGGWRFPTGLCRPTLRRSYSVSGKNRTPAHCVPRCAGVHCTVLHVRTDVPPLRWDIISTTWWKPSCSTCSMKDASVAFPPSRNCHRDSADTSADLRAGEGNTCLCGGGGTAGCSVRLPRQ